MRIDFDPPWSKLGHVVEHHLIVYMKRARSGYSYTTAWSILMHIDRVVSFELHFPA